MTIMIVTKKYEENKALIQRINSDLLAFLNSSFVMNTTTEYGKNGSYTTNDSEYTYDMFVELSLGMIESIEHIIHTIRTNIRQHIFGKSYANNMHIYILYVEKRPTAITIKIKGNGLIQ